MARLIRPQFSLATLLIAMAWSAVVVRMNVTPRFITIEIPLPKGFTGSCPGPPTFRVYGWPWACASWGPYQEWSYRALAGDAVVGALLVAVLTWASSQLLRRVTARFRRGRLPPGSTN